MLLPEATMHATVRAYNAETQTDAARWKLQGFWTCLSRVVMQHMAPTPRPHHTASYEPCRPAPTDTGHVGMALGADRRGGPIHAALALGVIVNGVAVARAAHGMHHPKPTSRTCRWKS